MLKAPLTLGQVLTAQARLQPDRRAAQDFTRAMTYREWNERACRLANGLLGLGLSKGDRVAVLAYNRIEWAEIYAATAKAGLVAVPINFRLTGQEALHILRSWSIRRCALCWRRSEPQSTSPTAAS
jgi:fatty-acyl-CoA synthase